MMDHPSSSRRVFQSVRPVVIRGFHEERTMPRFYLEDFRTLETMPSPRQLHTRLASIILSSITARVRLESVDQATGEYRVILSGRLDLDNSKTHRW